VDEGSADRVPRAARSGGVVSDHFATLRGTRGRLLWRQIIAQFAIPIALGGFVVWAQFRVTIIGELIAGFSVLAGFLFGLVIFVFQLRLGMSHDPRVQTRAKLPGLIDELFSNVLYAVGVAFALIFLAVVAAATEPLVIDLTTPAAQAGSAAVVLVGLDPWVSAAVVVVAAHLLAVIAMCMKRTRRASVDLKS
jgi:hypothetical protein